MNKETFYEDFNPNLFEVIEVDGTYSKSMTDTYIVDGYYNGEDATDAMIEWLNNSEYLHELLTKYFK
jgi:archaellum component FlaF (FlaF/FlaG flagellin family)